MSFLKINAKTRISLGLVCLLLSVLSTAMMLGMVPERESAVRDGRANLCETIALVSSDCISRGEADRLDQLLEQVVQRNDDVISAGVRHTARGLLSVFGEHEKVWPVDESSRSTDTHVRVPIRSGNERWGTVELSFRPLRDDTWLGVVRDPWFLMTGFVCLASFFLFQLYLKKMLAHLDPSKTVPKRVRTALDSLAEGLLVLDRQGRVVLANQSFADWLGTNSDKLLGRRADDLGWDLQHFELTPWQEAVDSESVIAGAMIELQVGDGPQRTLIANASPVLGQEGKCRGVLVSFDDVTQLEETKRDLTIAKRAADDANQAKSEFLARMSHEIRTPMNAILGYTDVLRRGFDTSITDRQEYLDTIHGSGEHLLALINDILDLSKVESGQLELEVGPCSPFKLIKEVTSLLRSKAEEKGIYLKFRGQGALPKEIQGDAVRLRQAIMNLAGNAIKFTEHGGVEIVARIEDETPSLRGQTGVRLAIDVTDTGIGISEEAQAKVFEPFAQADTSITRRFGGTGLGLAISKQLAEAMGGDIAVTSTVGVGTTFTIRIAIGVRDALELVDPAELASSANESSQQKSKVRQLPPCRILVADDGSPNRKLMKLVLGQAGADVLTVENGQLAVEAATQGDYDVVLMDMQMPVMDGYTATATLRELGYTKPIYALTANAMQGDQDKCFAAGCSGFLSKPIKIDLLLETLTEELGGHIAEEEAETPNDEDAEVSTTGDLLETTQVDSPSNEDLPTPCDDRPAPSDDRMAPSNDRPTLSDDNGPVLCSYPLDDPDFLEIAQDFVQALQTRLPQMRQSLDAAEFESLARDAHWLKGVGGSAGFEQFVDPSSRLQRSAEVMDGDACREQLGSIFSLASRIRLGDEAELPEESGTISSPAERPPAAETSPSGEGEPIYSTLPMDDPEFREIVVDFLDRLGAKLDDMHEAVQTGDWSEAASIAHWLRGTAGSLGIAHFGTPTLAMEKFAEVGDGVSCGLVMQDIRSIADRICVPVG